jgi:uncharacterized protein (DUF58 family)
LTKTFYLRRFYVVLGFTAFVLIGGIAAGFAVSHRLVYLLVLATMIAFVWNWVSLKSLEVTFGRRMRRARVGDNMEEEITVRNRSLLPKPVLEVEYLTDLPGASSGMAISLSFRGSRSLRCLVTARKRGVYTMGPVRVANTDALFGLFRREKLFGDTDSLVVYPRTFDVPGFAIPAAHLSGESSGRTRTQNFMPAAASVREYASGDSISRVHWNSTARLGKLMSKEFDIGSSSDVWLLVDLHRDTQAGELEESTDEYAVSIAASLAKRYLEAQLPLGLIAYGDRRYFLSADRGAGHLDKAMELLAMSKAEGTVDLEAALLKEELLWGYRSSLVVITASHRQDWVRALRELARRGVGVAVILLDGGSFGGYYDTLGVVPDLYGAGVAPYVVRRGDDIPAAMSRPYRSAELETPQPAAETTP